MAGPKAAPPGGTIQVPATMGAIDRLLDQGLGRAVDWMVGLIMGGLVLMVFSGVLARYVFNYSLAWSDELAGLLFVWLTLLGSVAALRRRTHMAIGFFPRLFAPRGQRVVGMYVMAAILFFLLFMVAEGIALTRATLDDKSAVLRLPIGLYYLSLPVAGILMLAYALRQVVALLWGGPNGWQGAPESAED
jgi:TRAP-type C4-dicarboxylate transport system permease small subunit